MSLSSRPPRALALSICASLALAIAGCGGAKESSTSTSSGDNSDAGRVKLAQCLRDNGVDIPDNPGQGGGGGGAANIDRDKVQEVMNGPCKKYQQGALGNISGADREEMQDSFQKFSQCMRDNGVDMPAGAAGGGPPAGGAGGIDQDDPKTQAATKKCRSELPQNLPGPGGN